MGGIALKLMNGTAKRSAAGTADPARVAKDEVILDHQRACAWQLSFLACTATADLSGLPLTVKCRPAGGGDTILRTPAFSASVAGVQLAAGMKGLRFVYEGKEALEFELCTRLPRSSTVLATGRLAMSAFFGSADPEETIFSAVQLHAQDGQPFARLTVSSAMLTRGRGGSRVRGLPPKAASPPRC